MRVVQTLACSQKQWWRSRKNPSECLLSRETACNNCWERRRHAWYTHYAHPHIMHTHTLYTPTHYAHRDMTCLLCSPPALPPSCSEHCTIIRNLMCVCVCVWNAIIPHPEHFLFRGPSHVEQSPRASPTCATQHARPAGDKTAKLLPSVSPCMLPAEYQSCQWGVAPVLLNLAA